MYEGQIYIMEEIEFLHEEELMGSQEVQLIESASTNSNGN